MQFEGDIWSLLVGWSVSQSADVLLANLVKQTTTTNVRQFPVTLQL